MRSLTRLILLALLVYGGYKAWHSPAIRSLVREYTAQTKSELANLNGGAPVAFDFKSIGNSFNNLMNMGMEGSQGEIPKAVTPGPLTKIPTASSGTSTQPAALPSQPAPVGPSSGINLTVKGIIAATNANRSQNGAGSLTESSKLDASALVKAADILRGQYFEHVSPTGVAVGDLVDDQGYAYIKIGENLALGDFSSDADVVAAWMNSPGHRANILDAQFKEMGVGIAYGTYKGHTVYVAVQHFGRPLSACPRIDAELKARVEAGQAELTKDANALQAQKASIDKAQAEGADQSAQVAAYNVGVDKYQADYAKIDALRMQYNEQVSAFNKCISTAN